jgi:hypothetical protein
MSDLNTRTLTINNAKAAIRHAFNKRRPVFLWGPPGIGKSDAIHQIGHEIGAHVIDVRLSLWEPTDIKGIPFYNATENAMCWAAPIELPSAEFAAKHDIIILFLDEMNSAPPSVQAAAYQLILNRRVGTYVLPDNVLVVAAGNREVDRGVVYRMPAPLANRFVHLEVSVNFDDWLSWAILNKVHKDIVGYISFSKQSLYEFDSRSASRAFATPRSWSFVSELLDDDISESTLADLVSGAVGEGTAVKFMAHRKVASRMPNPTDILNGKVTTLSVKEISAMYSLTVSMCYELKDAADKKVKGWDEMADRFFRFMMDNFETELVVMGAKVALTNYDLPLDPGKLKNFDEFHERFGKYVIAANQ